MTMRPAPRPPEDALSTVLGLMRVRGSVQGRLELGAPWGWRRALGDHAALYLVVDGGGWIEVEGARPKALARGDFVFVPPGRTHVLRDARRSRLNVDEERLRRLSQAGRPLPRVGGDGALTTLASGCCTLEGTGARRLLQALPPLVHVPGEEGSAARPLRSILELMAVESQEGSPGGPVVVARLIEVLLVRALRLAHPSGTCARQGWLGALADPGIGRALALIHEQPDAPWTVASLARAVGLSRSGFAARFVERVGESPLGYLTGWRMELAARLLRDEQLAVAEVAARVGYQADAAFARTFKRWSGVPPATYRRQES
jgi:AraC-like DNA-binding protein